MPYPLAALLFLQAANSSVPGPNPPSAAKISGSRAGPEPAGGERTGAAGHQVVTAMEPDELFEELQQVAHKLSVTVRQESTGGRVGRCLLAGEVLVLVDKYLPLRDKIEGLAFALADLDYEEIYMPELVRDLLHSRRTIQERLPL